MVNTKDGHKLLNIRNPWGKFEWDGDWSDNSDKWTEEIKEELDAVFDEHDGAFWMCFEDFHKHFCSFNVCYLKDWHEIRVKGKFIRTHLKSNPADDYVLSKFYYILKSDCE